MPTSIRHPLLALFACMLPAGCADSPEGAPVDPTATGGSTPGQSESASGPASETTLDSSSGRPDTSAVDSDGSTGSMDPDGSTGSTGSTGDEPWEPMQPPCAEPGTFGMCPVEGEDDRPYRVYLPSDADPSQPIPVVLMLHGGGGSAEAGILVSCPTGPEGQADTADPACLHQVAEREGFAAVYVNGTPSPLNPSARVFNGGGGDNGYQCVGGHACTEDIDDEAHIDAVLDDLGRWLHVDDDAIFATGLSNGGALAHRLACTRAERIAAIASVGAGNQYSTAEPCEPSEPVAVLHVHGSADPCWTYAQSNMTCAAGAFGTKIGVTQSMEVWVDRNGCDPAASAEPEPDEDGDLRYTVAHSWSSCEADVRLLELVGAGHTWPGGLQYGAEATIGAVAHEWGSERIWAFFDEHRR